MSKLKAIIVDDEPLARQLLEDMLGAHPEVEVVARCSNGFEAVKAVASSSPDLIFLDIQMPKLDGFEVLELLERDDLAVVFVTAYEQYALKAFDAHAVDYLLKPFSPERLAAAVEKVVRNRGTNLPSVDDLRSAVGADEQYLSRVVVKDGSRIDVIPVGEILWFGAEDDYIAIHTSKGSVLKHQTMTSMEKSLEPSTFVRIHRSTIVNITAIKAIELVSRDNYVAVLNDNTELRISRTGHKRIKELM